MARAGKGFKYLTLDSRLFKFPTKPEISGCSVPRPCFQKKTPPNLRLNASGAQSRTLTSAWGFPRQSFSYQTFFFNHAGESDWSARYPSANQNISTVPKRKGQLSLCAILLGAEVMKSEAPPRELCLPQSTGSLKLSTQENYTLKCMHAFGLGNSIFFSFWLLLWEINPEFNHACLANALQLTSSLPFFNHITHR